MDEILSQLRRREFVLCGFLREQLPSIRSRFTEIFGHLEVTESPSGDVRLRSSEVIEILMDLDITE